MTMPAAETSTARKPITAATASSTGEESRRPLDVTVASLVKPKRRRPTLVLAGLLLVALAALAGALVFGSLTTTVAVLAADGDLGPGQVVTAADLRVVEISELGDAVTIEAERQVSLLGQAARGPIPAGTILHPGLFDARERAVPPGMAVVGAELELGAVPGPDLRAGDRVDVLGVTAGLAGLEGPADAEALVLARATMWSVERPGDGIGGTIVVSVLVPVGSQTTVAQAAADDRLRLALVAGE